MSVTGDEAAAAPAEWLTVTEAAMACHVSERTVRRWVSEGVVQSRVETAGLRESRLILRGSLPQPSPSDTPCHATSTPVVTLDPDMAAPSDTSRQAVAGHDIEPPGIKSHRHVLSELALVTLRAEAAERERERLENDVEFLRAQLERRAEEAQRQAQAEEQLRVMLVRLEQTNAQLAATLVQKALPPASEVVEKPQKVRWWQRIWL